MTGIEEVKIETDERGFELHLLLDEEVCTFNGDGWLRLNVHAVAEELYDMVKQRIGPWLQERDNAYQEWRVSRAAGELTDAEREEEERCAALDMEGPNAKQYRSERFG